MSATTVRLLTLVSKRPGISPGQRFRLEQWAPHLRSQHGIELEFRAFESRRLTDILYRPGHRAEKAWLVLKDFWRCRAVLDQARAYDGVVIYREAALFGPAIYESLLARTGIPLIYDFDDAIWVPSPSVANRRFAHLRFYGKTASICKMSAVVTAGNEYLADYAQQHARQVVVVPTTVELAQYPLNPPPPESPFVIVWIGSQSTLPLLELVRPAIERLASTRDVVMRVICSEPPARPFAGVRIEFIPWTADGEGAAINDSHVEIIPLPDDDFARGKCACKALQYMAAGRPAVASPVGMNGELIRSGENGILADTQEQWVTALEQLAASPELRERLGRAGRATVETGFSATVGAARFADAVRLALSTTTGRRAV